MFMGPCFDPSQDFIDPGESLENGTTNVSKILIEGSTKFIKFIEVELFRDHPTLHGGGFEVCFVLKAHRLCAQARSKDGMPFHTQACKEYTHGCFVSCAEAHSATHLVCADQEARFSTYGPFKILVQATT
ncbi:hypothetical protein Tco_0793146 [Tanacetum coccineum]